MKLLADSDFSDSKAARLLRRLGFSGYESAVWLELVNGFPATAYQVAKRAGLQRANVYRALDRLAERQAVTVLHSKPALYAPADPRSLVARLTADLTGECDWFAGHVSTRMQSRNQGAIRTGTGVETCMERLREALGAARHYAWLKGDASTLGLFAADIDAACVRGVVVKMIAFGTWKALQKKLPRTVVYPHEGNAQRLSSATDSLMTLACDGRAVTTAVFSEQATVTSVQDHALTYQLHSYLLHEIFLAELVLEQGANGNLAQSLRALRKRHRPQAMERSLSSDQ
ncbi:MAG TPA: helix-turn-helix domain-containing protein [Bordetella sp.]|jgi:sugar-specific transcriptional regulator TrmB|nr:helix-turn-helix domain-containing protein [Bordetella sp.]